MSLVGELIKAKLKEQNKSQVWLGKQMNYSSQFICNWLMEKSDPPLKKLKTICLLLRIPKKDMLSALEDDYRRQAKEALK